MVTYRVDAFLFLNGSRNCSMVGATFCRVFELFDILRVACFKFCFVAVRAHEEHSQLPSLWPTLERK
jgi:hypothetical protein